MGWITNQDIERLIQVAEKFAEAAITAANAYEKAVRLGEQGIEIVKEMTNEAAALEAYDAAQLVNRPLIADPTKKIDAMTEDEYYEWKAGRARKVGKGGMW